MAVASLTSIHDRNFIIFMIVLGNRFSCCKTNLAKIFQLSGDHITFNYGLDNLMVISRKYQFGLFIGLHH